MSTQTIPSNKFPLIRPWADRGNFVVGELIGPFDPLKDVDSEIAFCRKNRRHERVIFKGESYLAEMSYGSPLLS